MAVTERLIFQCDVCDVKSESDWFRPVGWYVIRETGRANTLLPDREVCGACFARAFGRDNMEKMAAPRGNGAPNARGRNP